jgi:hypothetical protein
MDDWVLVDLKRISVSCGIGCYRGCIYDSLGRLVATLAQEATFELAEPAPGTGSSRTEPTAGQADDPVRRRLPWETGLPVDNIALYDTIYAMEVPRDRIARQRLTALS